MSKHTEGPWEVMPDANGFNIYAKSKNDVWLSVVTPAERGVIKSEANARLIAAAPELLAALHEAHGLLSSFDYISRNNYSNLSGECADLCKAAIAKAVMP